MEKKWDLGFGSLVSTVLQWILVMVAFVASTISMYYSDDPQGMWTAIWCLSIVKIVDLTDK